MGMRVRPMHNQEKGQQQVRMPDASVCAYSLHLQPTLRLAVA